MENPTDANQPTDQTRKIVSQQDHLEMLSETAVSNFPLHVAVNESGYPERVQLYSKCHKESKYDFRSMKPNEILFKIDIAPWAKCVAVAEKIRNHLQKNSIPHHLFLAGDRSIDIHIFFQYDDADSEMLPTTYVKDAFAKGFQMKHMRTYLYKAILQDAGIDFDPTVFDIKTVNYDDEESKYRLVRICGGKHIKEDQSITYKIFLDDHEEIPGRKDCIKDAANIKYPQEIRLWNVPETEVLGCIERFHVDLQKEREQSSEYNADFLFDGQHLELECIQNIIKNGCKDGERNKGAHIITVAGLLDHRTDDEIEETLREYRNNCQNNHSFTHEEACSWLGWLKKRPSIHFSHRLAKKYGNCGATCKYEQNKYAKVIELLKRPDLLDIIIKVIKRDTKYANQQVIYEDNNLKIIYLGMLSAITSNPLNIYLVAVSSGGKTVVVTACLDYFPEDMLLVLQSASKKSLYYDADSKLPDGTPVVNLSGKVLVLLEESTSQDLIAELKSILSHDRKEVTVKTVIDNKIYNVIIRGWPAYFGLSVNNLRSEELETRGITISPIVSQEKTRAILLNDVQSAVFNENKRAPFDEDVKQIPAILDRTLKVQNLYKLEMQALFPDDNPSVVRHWKQMNALIDSHALLHQFQRKHMDINGVDFILVDHRDVIAIAEIFAEGLRSTLTGISLPVKEFWDKVVLGKLKDSGKKEFTKKELLAYYKATFGRDITPYNLMNMIMVLENKGFANTNRSNKEHLFSFDDSRPIGLEADEFKKAIKALKPLDKNEIEARLAALSGENNKEKEDA